MKNYILYLLLLFISLSSLSAEANADILSTAKYKIGAGFGGVSYLGGLQKEDVDILHKNIYFSSTSGDRHEGILNKTSFYFNFGVFLNNNIEIFFTHHYLDVYESAPGITFDIFTRRTESLGVNKNLKLFNVRRSHYYLNLFASGLYSSVTLGGDYMDNSGLGGISPARGVGYDAGLGIRRIKKNFFVDLNVKYLSMKPTFPEQKVSGGSLNNELIYDSEEINVIFSVGYIAFD